MKTWVLWLAMVLVLASGCGGRKRQLNVFIWSEYIDPAVVAEFERLHECRVVLDLYEDAESMVAKLAAGGDSTYDIVVPSNNTLVALIQRGLVAPLDHTRLPNLKNLEERFTRMPFDPGNRYGVPYQWGTTGLYLRRKAGEPVDESWALVFDPARQPGPFLLVEDPRSCIGAALRYRGHAFNSVNPMELAEARELLLSAKERSMGFEGTVGARNRVLSKAARIAIVSSTDGVRGVKEDPETHYFIPREGGEVWMDLLAIPARAPHRELAERFIDFILEARVGARVATFNRAATPNRAALEHVEAADRANAAIYPPEAVLKQLEYAEDLGKDNERYDRLWTEIKAR